MIRFGLAQLTRIGALLGFGNGNGLGNADDETISRCTACTGDRCLQIQTKILFWISHENGGTPQWNEFIADATVTLGSLTCMTNDAGRAYFDVSDLAAGTHDLDVCLDPPDGLATTTPASPGSARGLGEETPRAFRRVTGRARVVIDGNGARIDDLVFDTDNARAYQVAGREAIVDWRPDFFYSGRRPERAGGGFRFAVLHRTDGRMMASLTRLGLDHTSGVSAHYLIDLDGFAVKLVPDEYAARHVGDNGRWRDSADLQDESIGFEIVGFGDTTFRPAQYDSVISILRGYGFGRLDVAGHRDVDLGGTSCPTVGFDWARLARAGFCPSFRQNWETPDATLDALVSARYPEGLPATWEEASNTPEGLVDRVREDLRAIGYSDELSLAQALGAFRARFMVLSNEARGLDRQTARVMASIVTGLGLPYAPQPTEEATEEPEPTEEPAPTGTPGPADQITPA